ncbi:uncharacterized protein LOC101208478 isoform X1 [Cucumis sativus]|uniref:Uncharacterized protein n=1 Tax=Cucumis sativus TaxID=3659 RepID=A0A0A0M216_CUCSA|nr:uncharacterized protein LOC101208478 isoform X1 [Cucumis sativus]XP_011660004.1 uncharacterized protein LOC101208478 isoform X1 [Cucumis sativus]XP_031746002.1 uncharacterized protein LOC101208478 isoform X1 [Cucumis sativus]KGN66266.1 hypothetical protein Csa_007481 [Cucumis sativus]
MVMSSKFEFTSSSPDRPLHSSGQRGAHMAVPLDRSGSFRESLENPNLSTLPNMSRSASAVSQGEVLNFLQCLHFGRKLVATDEKSNRQGDFSRQLQLALSMSPDDSPSSSSKGKLPSVMPEEIKRMKVSLRECSIKARERLKLFNEALSVFNKFFPSVPSKKRSRLEGYNNERSNFILSGERSARGQASKSHAIPGGAFEHEMQKSEERIKNALSNKRTRTSLVDARGMDVRNNPPVRPSGAADRERDALRLANSGAVPGEDRSLSIGVDGWEKSKMKKKRSVIKPDASSSSQSTKPVDSYDEVKQQLQQRPVSDARSRINKDNHGFRPGVANGASAVGKSDGISQQNGLGIRSSMSRSDLDSNSLVNDRRDNSIGSDKERVNLRGVNKSNVRDDFVSTSPTSNAKVNPSVRAPRSSSGIAPKFSPVVHRAIASNDWDMSNCTNKPISPVGVSNRKRMISMRSSSPPVSHWASQRPQKISRSARRTNLGPIVSSNDDNPLDSTSDVVGNDTGLGFGRRMSGSSPQQVKIKGEPLSSAAQSESEESGAAEIKSREKTRKSEDLDDKSEQGVQKVPALVLPTRKNKSVDEDIGDGVRRQGRTGRAFPSTRSLMPMTVEKIDAVGTAKQLRSARLGFDKVESKAGRPPTRKFTDRKAYKRQKHSAINVGTDFLVGSDHGHEELLAAANAVTNPGRTFFSPFWRQMEQFFRFVSEADITHLRKQGDLEGAASGPKIVSDKDAYNISHDNFEHIENEASEVPLEHIIQESKDHTVIPLYQRLLASLIPEEVADNENEDTQFDRYGMPELDEHYKPNKLSHEISPSSQFSGHSANDDHNMRRGSGSDPYMPETDRQGIPNSVRNSLNGLISNQALMPGMACSEFQYDDMPLNEKLLLEIQSIGIFPDSVPEMLQIEEEEITNDIRQLEEKKNELVSRKNSLLHKLLQSALGTKQLQEKEFERLAMDKLVAMAYEKYMACKASNASSGKNSNNKMAKQAALAFVKRTLNRCHKFEDTGKSFFSEPSFREMYSSWSVNPNGERQSDPVEGESEKSYASIQSLDARVSALAGSQNSPSHFNQNLDNHDVTSGNVLPPATHQAERTTGREELWSNRVKKRELLLDDVGNAGAPSVIGSCISSSAKGKRSERDRDGKGHNREVSSRNGTKIGRPALSNTKGERKTKTKPKHKTAQLSISVNGLLGKMAEQPKSTLSPLPKSSTSTGGSKEKDQFGLDGLDDPDSIDLSNLQLPGMDVLGVPDDLDGQGQDLGSWLNIDEDGLQDQDFMGLEIPMDDLSDLNMMV